MPAIQIFDSNNEPRIISLVADRYTMGRRNDCDILFESWFVSRRHATLVKDEDGGYTIFDGIDGDPSANGLWMGENEWRLERVKRKIIIGVNDRDRCYRLVETKMPEKISTKKLQDQDVVYFGFSTTLGFKYLDEPPASYAVVRG